MIVFLGADTVNLTTGPARRYGSRLKCQRTGQGKMGGRWPISRYGVVADGLPLAQGGGRVSVSSYSALRTQNKRDRLVQYSTVPVTVPEHT